VTTPPTGDSQTTESTRLGRLAWIGAALAAAAGLAQLALLASVFVRRAGYPFDLEWMEGGMLCHALRAMEGRPIYAPPSADFISYLYTPFYPYVLAALGKIFGLSYTLGRVVSIASFVATCGLLFRVVQRQVGGVPGALWGLGALGLVAATFPQTGAWYDLVRNDSLYLALITGALYLICYHHRSWPSLITAGVLAGLAYLTKQTASLFIMLSGLALLLMRWRRLPVHVAVVGLVAGGGALLLDKLHHGWFWKYTFGMHQGHDLYWDRIWPVTELKLLRFTPAVGAVIGVWVLGAALVWALRRRPPQERRLLPRDRTNLFWFATAICGVAVSAVGFATQWASDNAYIPGLVFPGVFAVIAAADLVEKIAGSPASVASSRRSLRPLLAAVASLLLGGALAAQLVLQLYKPARHLPTARDRRAGVELIEQLRRIDGPVLVPYHPYYSVLAGKRPTYHQMGINDVTRAGYPFPTDLFRRIITRGYGGILLDNPPRGRYDFVLDPYKLASYFREDEVPRVVTGYLVRPTYLFVPKRPDPVPPGARRVFDFESGTYDGWTPSGVAFGARPAGGPVWDQGPVGPFEGSYLANSYNGGDHSTGVLRSREFVVDRPFLSYRVGGGADPQALVVRLLVDDQPVHEATGIGSEIMQLRRVDVHAFQGRKMRVELIDRATGPWGHLLFDDLTLRSQ
jgi:hypothetical protein